MKNYLSDFASVRRYKYRYNSGLEIRRNIPSIKFLLGNNLDCIIITIHCSTLCCSKGIWMAISGYHVNTSDTNVTRLAT